MLSSSIHSCHPYHFIHVISLFMPSLSLISPFMLSVHLSHQFIHVIFIIHAILISSLMPFGWGTTPIGTPHLLFH